MRKLMSLALTLVLSLALSAPTAAAGVGTSGSTGSVPVTISAEAAAFSVTVPASIPVSIDANADVTCPNNLSITNHSAGAVQVTSIQMKDAEWTLANYNNGDRALLAAEKVDAKKIGFAITPAGGTQSATSGVGTQTLNIDANEWTIAGDGKSLEFTCDAIASAVSSVITNAVHAVDVVFTIGWCASETSSVSDAPYLTFTSPSDFSIEVATPGWDGTIEYSPDAEDWKEWDGSRLGVPASDGEAILYLRGTGNTVITGGIAPSKNKALNIGGAAVACHGNIETLLDYATVEAGNHPSMGTCCYSGLFYQCGSLITAPTLPTTALTAYCYASMFNGCTSLTTAPELPATTLAKICYEAMFYNCTSLTTAPELPATTLAYACYFNMFYGCTSLTTVPALPATTLADCCYQHMFRGCTSLKVSATQIGDYTRAYRIPISGDGTMATDALSDMFTGTGGTFTGTPTINTTYYLHSSNSIVG